MQFYLDTPREGTPVPPTVWKVIESIMRDGAIIGKLTLVKIALDVWKVENRDTAGLIKAKGFVEFLAEQLNYKFRTYDRG